MAKMIAHRGKSALSDSRRLAQKNCAEQRFDRHRHLDHQLAILLIGVGVGSRVTCDLAARLGVVPPAGEIISVRQRSKSAIEGDNFKIVFGKFEFLDNFWPQEAHDVGTNRVLETRVDFFCDCGAADKMAPLKDKDFLSGLCEIGGTGETIVAAAYNDCVIFCHRFDLLRQAFLVILCTKSMH